MKENIEEAIDRLEYVNRAYDCNNYYSRYDLDCIQILLSDYKRVLKINEVLLKENELLRKDIEGWKKYCEEIEEEQTEMSNKNCELEFEIEKLQKEDTEQKSEIKKIEHDNQTLKNFVSGIFNENIEKDFIPVQKVEDKISERQFELQQEYKDFEDDAILIVLQGLLKGEN